MRPCGGRWDSVLQEQHEAEGFLEAPAWPSTVVALAPGTQLGPYLIEAAIGAGGMGEVYRARDTRLDRTVAIKVLPPEAAVDSERRRRFEHEARAVSALNHPHICTLYDIGDAGLTDPVAPGPGRVSYIVLEHLEGHTLAERLAKGPLSMPQALDVGAQIAEALGAAHRKGIVHRDLKPANVMLTKASAPTGSGVHVKLLDFGLAKLRAHGEQPLVASSAAGPSASASLTARGEILGTWPYMAPEQVEGKTADARTDIWALGAVLYEMLAGARAFPGDNTPALCAAILEREPAPLAPSPAGLPPALSRLVTTCLAKDPARRPQTSADVRASLEALRNELVRRPNWFTRAGRRVWPPRTRGRASFVSVLGASVRRLWMLSSSGAFRRTSIPVDVYDRYVYGRERCAEYDPLSLADGIAALQDVVGREPSFAPAHAQLGHSLTLKANLSAEQAGPLLELAKHHVADAIRLDPDLGLAHAASVLVKLMLDRDWSGAGASSLKAVQTDPYSAVCWNARGAYQLAIGDSDGAVTSFQQAERLNPRSPFDRVHHGFALIIAGRPAEAVEQHRRTIQQYPDFVFARMELAWALLDAGKPSEALIAHDEARRLSPSGSSTGVDCWLNRVDFVAGDPGRARQLVADWTDRAKREWVDPFDLARLFAGVDDVDGAVAWLERAYAAKSANFWCLEVWYHLHPKVFRDARFQDVRRRLNLPD